MTDTPSQEIVKKSSRTATFEAGGHKITIKKMTAADEYQLYKVVGKAQENQGQFMALATIYHVTHIDESPVPRGSLLQLEATISRLADCFEDVMLAVVKLKAEDLEDAQNFEDKIKNLLPGQTQ